MWVTVALTLSLIGDALIIGAVWWTRAALVSLNKDMRIMLDRQGEIRARLAALEEGE